MVLGPNDIIVFDLDDTLYLESTYVRSGFRVIDRALTRDGIHGFYARAWSRFESGQRTKMFDTVLEQLNIAPSAQRIAALVQIYREHSPEIALTEDADRLLRALTGRVRLGIITDGYAVAQRCKLEALGLPSRMDAIIVSDELGGRQTWKPSPEPFRALAQAMGGPNLHRARLTYIGDNPHKDFVTARALGWNTVRIRRSGGLHAELDAKPHLAADVDVGDFDELWRRWTSA